MRSGLPFLPPVRRRSVLSRAVASWRAGLYSSGIDSLVDMTGNGLHARLGSAVGADSNDPLRLQYSGAKDVYFPAINGNYISTPDAAPLRITGNIESIARTSGFAAANTDRYFGGRFNTATANRSYYFGTSTSDGRYLAFVTNVSGGAVNNSATSTAAVPVTGESQMAWVKATKNTATGTTTFYYSLEETNNVDAVTWTQLGDPVVTSAEAIFAGNANLEIGSRLSGAASLLNARLSYYCVKNGIGGTKVAEFMADQLAEPYASYTDPQGNVWTLNRSASGRKLCVVDRDLLLLGTDDYLEVADSPLLDFGAAQSFTVVAAMRAYGTAASDQVTLKKAVSPTPRYQLSLNTTSRVRAFAQDGTNLATADHSTYAAGVAFLASMVLNRSAGLILAGRDNSQTSGALGALGTLDNSSVVNLGRDPGGSGYLDAELIGAAIFREPLSAADLVRLKQEMLAR